MSFLPNPGNLNSWSGWIPTVSGQLSFSIIGHSSAAANCTYVNDLLPKDAGEDTPARYVALHQFRTAPDYPYPDSITRRLFPGAAQDFFLVAETCEADIQVNLPRNADGEPRVLAISNAQGVLTGKVFVLLHDKDAKQRASNKAFIARLKKSMWLSDREKFEETKEALGTILDEGQKSGIPLLEVNFSLFRTGEFKIWIDPNSWQRVIASDLLEEAIGIFPNQIFYFVKDVVHRHYHHDGSSDQMLSLTRTSHDNTKSEIDWRRHTLWGLVRVVMQYRRTGRWPDLQKARGVAAYAEAFQGSFANCLRSSEGVSTFVPTSRLSSYDFKHIRESIDVSAVESASTRNAIWQALTLGVTVVLAVLLAWSSYGSKTLSLRLAACGPEKSSNFWPNLRTEIGCREIMANSVTIWESWAYNQPFLLIALLLMVLAAIYNPVLRDVPMAKSWIGRHWQSLQAILLLFIYALHTSMIRTDLMVPHWFVRIKSRLPLAMLLGAFGLEFWWLFAALRSL